MTKKIYGLIAASIAGLLALSLVQGYLIKNSYTLKKESLIQKTNQAVSRIDDYTPGVDSINTVWQRLFIRTLDQYNLKQISKEKVVYQLRTITDSLNGAFIKAYDKELMTKKLDYDLKFHKIVTNIIVVDSTQTDTIFKGRDHPVFKLLGYDFENHKELRISNSVWHTERTFTKELENTTQRGYYQLYFETEDYINIDQWKSIIYKQMAGLLILSFLVFAFVIGVLYYSIKNLITQKKIADIKTDFINNITHELKTPLATLTLATKMLKKKEVQAQPELITTTVHTIERQNIRLQKLIDQVLDNSLGYTAIQLKREEIAITNYLHTVLDDFLLSLTDKEVVLDRNVEVTDALVRIDKFHLTTAIINMLENAVKYGGTHLHIMARIQDEKKLIISISDNGVGVSKKDQKLLFQKFFRADNTTIHDVKGLGLGLYYSNQIIKVHGGMITVDSEKGKGSNFTFIIPLS